MTQRRHVDQIGVLRVDPDAGDLTRIVETHMGPALAGVGGTVDADSRRDVPPGAGRARTYEDYVGIRFGDGDGTHRRGGKMLVGDVLPAHAGVGGLPYPASGGAHVVGLEVTAHTGDRRHPAATVGTDEAELHRPGELFVEGRLRLGLGALGGQTCADTGDEQRHDQHHYTCFHLIPSSPGKLW